MSSKISIITPVNNRPNIWPWYERMVSRAIKSLSDNGSDAEVEIVIADDSRIHMPVTLPNARHLKKEHRPDVSILDSFRSNLLDALTETTGDRIYIWEDDDWHRSVYLNFYEEAFDFADAVGEARSHYYHVPTGRYYTFTGGEHASLCQTAFRRPLVELFIDAIEESCSDCGVDIRFWRTVRAVGLPHHLGDESRHTVGIKGLSDRPLASGHNPLSSYYQRIDSGNWQQLEAWIGADDAEFLMREVYGRL